RRSDPPAGPGRTLSRSDRTPRRRYPVDRWSSGAYNQTDRSVFSPGTTRTRTEPRRDEMAGTKGLQTRQRIVEMAAPVFNRQGYVGASMRDLISATGLEKGGIYNHF